MHISDNHFIGTSDIDCLNYNYFDVHGIWILLFDNKSITDNWLLLERDEWQFHLLNNFSFIVRLFRRTDGFMMFPDRLMKLWVCAVIDRQLHGAPQGTECDSFQGLQRHPIQESIWEDHKPLLCAYYYRRCSYLSLCFVC